MKRDELIEMLKNNFKSDENVVFLYENDCYETRGDAKEVCVDEQTYYKHHWEVKENGKWVRWENNECHPTRDYEYCHKWKHEIQVCGGRDVDESWWKDVIDGEEKSVVKCIRIK